MPDPMKIRALMKGDVAEIKVLMSHVMETGLRKDESGAVIPAHFIQTLSIAVNGKLVVSGQTNTSVSKNPVFGFKVKGAKAGDKVSISWTDNRGDQRTDEAVIG
jgi:sulfur-oxidizing protein SoxZ